MITESTIQSIIDAIKAGETPKVDPELVPCFSAAALENSPIIRPEHLAQILEGLTEDDIPALERAIVSLRLNDQAWIGFKIVYDAEACMRPDNQSFDMGPSEDDKSTLFFANESKDIVASRPYNKRDRKQMLDCTRGPSMHVDQFAGVAWCSVPLFTTQRVVIYGAGEVSVFMERYCHDCGFDTVVLDDDAAFLTEERFPLENLPEKWRAFHWNVIEVDGHDMNALIDVFDNLPAADSDVPTLIVCNTEKGHGVSFMANNPDWHMGNITDETMNKALAELKAAYKEKWGED